MNIIHHPSILWYLITIFVVAVACCLYYLWQALTPLWHYYFSCGPYRYFFHRRLTTAEGMVLRGKELRQYKQLYMLAGFMRWHAMRWFFYRITPDYRYYERLKREYRALMTKTDFKFCQLGYTPAGEERLRREFDPLYEMMTFRFEHPRPPL